MKRAWFQLRCLIGEHYLHMAFAAMPKGSSEELAMCMASEAYVWTLKLKNGGASDQAAADLVRGRAT